MDCVTAKHPDDESSAFICTECGDGFKHYPQLLCHMASHEPLDKFCLDGSSNGFEVPHEYVLHENGTLTMVNKIGQSPKTSIKQTPSIPSQSISVCQDVRGAKTTQVAASNTDKSQPVHCKCETCNRSFNNQMSLHRHQQYQNSERGHKCTLCCKIFEGREALKKHLKEHSHERFYCCGTCGERFLKLETFHGHQKERHQSSKLKPVSKFEKNIENRAEKTYPCKKCRLHFFWLSDLQSHTLYLCKGKDTAVTPVQENNLKPELDYNLLLKNSNDTSINVKCNRIATETPSFLRPYRCGLCGDRFQKLIDLKEHHLTHQTQEEIDQLNQETCERRITGRGRHRSKKVSNSKVHPCKHCHRVFNHSSSLSRHMRYHKGTLHTCVFCGRHFPQRCDVRRHIAMYHKTELEKKPGLKHMALHTNPQRGSPLNSHKIREKQQKNQDFNNKQIVLDGEQEQTEKLVSTKLRVNYKCQECGKKFGLLCVYQRHLRYHKREPTESHKCPQCPARFRQCFALERHLVNHQQRPSPGKTDAKGQTPQTASAYTDPDMDKGNEECGKGSSSEVLYECTECTETFFCLQTFLQHQSSHGSDKIGL